MKNYNSDLISDMGTSRKVTAHRNVWAAVQNKKIKKRNKECKKNKQNEKY
jgi:hypothetical protein